MLEKALRAIYCNVTIQRVSRVSKAKAEEMCVRVLKRRYLRRMQQFPRLRELKQESMRRVQRYYE